MYYMHVRTVRTTVQRRARRARARADAGGLSRLSRVSAAAAPRVQARPHSQGRRLRTGELSERAVALADVSPLDALSKAVATGRANGEAALTVGGQWAQPSADAAGPRPGSGEMLANELLAEALQLGADDARPGRPRARRADDLRAEDV